MGVERGKMGSNGITEVTFQPGSTRVVMEAGICIVQAKGVRGTVGWNADGAPQVIGPGPTPV